MNYPNNPLNVYQYVTFSQFYWLVNIRFLRLKMGTLVLEDGKSETYIENVHLVKIKGNANGNTFETQDEYEVRCTESLKSAIVSSFRLRYLPIRINKFLSKSSICFTNTDISICEKYTITFAMVYFQIYSAVNDYLLGSL